MKRCAALWHLHAWKALKFHKKTIHLAPIFDHGLSLLFSCTDDSAVAEYDVMADKRVNNFIGSSSTWENLHMIPKEKLPQLHALKETDRNFLMNGLDGIISQTLLKPSDIFSKILKSGKIWDLGPKLPATRYKLKIQISRNVSIYFFDKTYSVHCTQLLLSFHLIILLPLTI